MSGELKDCRKRIARAEAHLAMLQARPPDPREERLPMDVANRCRRAARALRSAAVALRPVYKKDLDRAGLKVGEAERELQLADELIARLAGDAGARHG